jgi:hypothetical protein
MGEKQNEVGSKKVFLPWGANRKTQVMKNGKEVRRDVDKTSDRPNHEVQGECTTRELDERFLGH